ncbi:hypothetical protein L9F63_003944, partial [Diploptera punctata]
IEWNSSLNFFSSFWIACKIRFQSSSKIRIPNSPSHPIIVQTVTLPHLLNMIVFIKFMDTNRASVKRLHNSLHFFCIHANARPSTRFDFLHPSRFQQSFSPLPH